MKKIATFVLYLIFLVTVTGCHFEWTQDQTQPEHIHDYKNKRVIAPTCVNDGYTLLICDCGALMRTAYVNKTDHDFQISQVVEATYTEGGYTIYTCHCGESCRGNETEPLMPLESPRNLWLLQYRDGYFDGWYGNTPDVSHCKAGHLYYYFYNGEAVSAVYLLVDEPVDAYMKSYVDNTAYVTKKAEPSKIYSITLEEISQQRVVYESSYGTITDICMNYGRDDLLHITEGGKRFILLDLNTGDFQEILEVYSLQSAEAYFDEDGNISHVLLSGQPTEKHKSYDYFYYPATGEFQEHNG